jgi:transposase
MRDLADADGARVAVLTLEGMTVRNIARKTGLSKSAVNRLQQKAKES